MTRHARVHHSCSHSLDVLHLSEAEAYLRIAAARAARKHPVLLDMLADGRLHLTAVSMLAKYLTDENRDELLARAVHRTKRQLEELIASLAPKPDVPAQIRKLPQRPRPGAPKPEPAPVATRAPASRPSIAAKPASPPRVEPLAPARYKVQFTAGAELKEKLERLQALRPGVDLAALIDDAVTEKLQRIEASKFGKVRKPRTEVEDADTSAGGRHIAAAVKRFVDERDGRQCTFVSDHGRRCPARKQLEYHHDDPHGLGGERGPDNVRLVCRQHNLYLAERVYGKDKMVAYRRDHDGSARARETLARFELFPDKVRNPSAANSAEPDAAPRTSHIVQDVTSERRYFTSRVCG